MRVQKMTKTLREQDVLGEDNTSMSATLSWRRLWSCSLP